MRATLNAETEGEEYRRRQSLVNRETLTKTKTASASATATGIFITTTTGANNIKTILRGEKMDDEQ
jgi:hypothetical protein